MTFTIKTINKTYSRFFTFKSTDLVPRTLLQYVAVPGVFPPLALIGHLLSSSMLVVVVHGSREDHNKASGWPWDLNWFPPKDSHGKKQQIIKNTFLNEFPFRHLKHKMQQWLKMTRDCCYTEC